MCVCVCVCVCVCDDIYRIKGHDTYAYVVAACISPLLYQILA